MEKTEDERKEPCIRTFLRGMSGLSTYTDIPPGTYKLSYFSHFIHSDKPSYHTYIHPHKPIDHS